MEAKKRTLRIGVTGRRHIVPASEAKVVESARALLRAIAERYDGVIEIYTGLAVGADQIAAQLAFETREAVPGAQIRVIAVTPKTIAAYEHDFKRTPEANGASQLETFRALLARCDDVIDLGVPEVDDDPKTNPSTCYARLGDWLVENCPAMLAFWNGNTSARKPGGTVDVALCKAARCAADGGFVCCVSTPELLRKKNADGTKTYIPEPIEGAGNLAVLRAEPTDAIEFVAPEVGVASVLAALK